MSADEGSGWQPASQAMSEQTARDYQARTGGQLVAFCHSDGNWYLGVPIPPAAATVPVASGGVPLRRRVPPQQGGIS